MSMSSFPLSALSSFPKYTKVLAHNLNTVKISAHATG